VEEAPALVYRQVRMRLGGKGTSDSVARCFASLNMTSLVGPPEDVARRFRGRIDSGRLQLLWGFDIVAILRLGPMFRDG